MLSEDEQQPGEGPDQPDHRGSAADAASFGDPRVDAAVARTDGLDQRPVGEHVDVFDDVHRSLRDALDDPGSGA
ncbi:MAG TPA: hypothetical protein VFJ14_07120 [Nocardioidaceae bacterium]|nr:hypothetical protein [Nocardioidaceae bacterium]